MPLLAPLAPENQGLCRSPILSVSVPMLPVGSILLFLSPWLTVSVLVRTSDSVPPSLGARRLGWGDWLPVLTCGLCLPCSPVRLSGLDTSFSRSLEAGPLHRHPASLSKSPELILATRTPIEGRQGSSPTREWSSLQRGVSDGPPDLGGVLGPDSGARLAVDTSLL